MSEKPLMICSGCRCGLFPGDKVYPIAGTFLCDDCWSLSTNVKQYPYEKKCEKCGTPCSGRWCNACYVKRLMKRFSVDIMTTKPEQ